MNIVTAWHLFQDSLPRDVDALREFSVSSWEQWQGDDRGLLHPGEFAVGFRIRDCSPFLAREIGEEVKDRGVMCKIVNHLGGIYMSEFLFLLYPIQEPTDFDIQMVSIMQYFHPESVDFSIELCCKLALKSLTEQQSYIAQIRREILKIGRLV